ncbi:MAG TPA: hypothetical protein VHM93_08090 [Candidatus Acidoferrum sp.]|jgi:hypothetical protein|nr:hypothetical protein [Candidatus Acidoferrum sp.]
MNGKMLLVLVLLAAASVAASGPRGTVPRAAANRYPSHAEQESFSVGAALLTSDEVRKTFVSELNRCCVVVEVALYPPKDKPQSVSLDDFSIRVLGSETAVKPSSAKVVAASIQKSAQSQRDVTVSPSAGVAYESGPYGHGTYREVGVAIGISEPGAHSGSSERDRDTMQTELSEKGLPEGTASAPVAGYLYFPLTKKKNTPLQLDCALNGSKVVLTLP